MCALIISISLSWIRASLRKGRNSDRNTLPTGIFSLPLNRRRFLFFFSFMYNYKLKISITWSTIYAVTALSKRALPCLIQVENSCLWGFLIHSVSHLLVRFSLSLLLGKWSGNSFLKYESQVPKLLVASTSRLLTINRAVKINPQDCTSGGHRTDTQTSEPYKLHVFEGFRLFLKPLPSKHEPETSATAIYKPHL